MSATETPTFRVVLRSNDGDAKPLLQRQERDLVRNIVVDSSQDNVAPLERNGRQCTGVGIRSAGRCRNIVGRCIEQFGRSGIKSLDGIPAQIGRFVATHLGFQRNMARDSVDDGRRHERRPGIVQVNDVLRAGGFGAEGFRINHGFFTSATFGIPVIKVLPIYPGRGLPTLIENNDVGYRPYPEQGCFYIVLRKTPPG